MFGHSVFSASFLEDALVQRVFFSILIAYLVTILSCAVLVFQFAPLLSMYAFVPSWKAWHKYTFCWLVFKQAYHCTECFNELGKLLITALSIFVQTHFLVCVCCVGKCATVLIWRSEKNFCGREWIYSKYNSFLYVWNYKRINELKNEIQEWAPTDCMCVKAWMYVHVCVLHTQKQLSPFRVALTHVCRDVNWD